MNALLEFWHIQIPALPVRRRDVGGKDWAIETKTCDFIDKHYLGYLLDNYFDSSHIIVVNIVLNYLTSGGSLTGFIISLPGRQAWQVQTTPSPIPRQVPDFITDIIGTTAYGGTGRRDLGTC